VQVKQVEIGRATVAYDATKVTPEALRQAVAGAGYQVAA
jgi:copper chaperone CopZ